MMDEYNPLAVYEAPNELTSPKFAAAFAHGCGGEVRQKYRMGRWSGFGSPMHLDGLRQTIADGFDYYYGDHAYFGRHRFFRVTKNALFHDGAGRSDMKRIVRHFYSRPKSWNKGRKIILCPQSEAFFLRLGMTQQNWIDDVKEELRLYTDRPIAVHHKRDTRPLLSLLRDTHCVISHSSNSAVEAIMNGVPAINTAPSAAVLMCRRKLCDVENLLYPENRLEWAGVLADNQWTLEEISNGDCWRKLQGE
jgi:hypothetical protein